MNTAVIENTSLINKIATVYGDQSILVGIDLKKIINNYFIFTNNGQKKENINIKDYIAKLSDLNFGELYLNSINNDGTGIGLDYEMLNFIPKGFKRSIILSGGTGNFHHIYDGLERNGVNAIATANLLNFIGDSLIKTRLKLISKKIPFPAWNTKLLKESENYFKRN